MYRAVIEPNSFPADTNDNSDKFTDSQVMQARITFFSHKAIHKACWISPDLRTANHIDHMLVVGTFSPDCANIDSGLYLVAVTMRSKLSMIYRQRQNTPRVNIQSPQTVTNHAQCSTDNSGLRSLHSTEKLDVTSLNDGWNRIHAAMNSEQS